MLHRMQGGVKMRYTRRMQEKRVHVYNAMQRDKVGMVESKVGHPPTLHDMR